MNFGKGRVGISLTGTHTSSIEGSVEYRKAVAVHNDIDDVRQLCDLLGREMSWTPSRKARMLRQPSKILDKHGVLEYPTLRSTGSKLVISSTTTIFD
ncbi:hypothetical protein Clacol_010330 [Clathrus columnatus]|uniref:Uncharacterized protein n=1 Tax=Clathrus columnatus TaxID=1419009 RepID=A0AAV5AN26_9AGAM|nr:hypothetical protein Clacol_010330 [Clathrus columnatus]